MIRSSSLRNSVLELPVALLGIACLMGCGSGAQFPTATELPDEPRRPDGIAVDLASEPPTWRERAESRDELVTLRTPLGTDVALRTVRSFFEAMVSENMPALDDLVAPDAVLQDIRSRAGAPGGQGATQTVTAVWRERFNKHEFKSLSPSLLYREGDVTIYRKEQLDVLPIAVRYVGPAPATVAPTDLVLHVPIVTHTVKSEKLLGEEMFFWLRREGDQYLIYRMAEDLPF